MRIQASLIALLLAATNTYAAVSLSNLTATQREGSKLVDIYFDAANSSGSSVSISVLVSNGTQQVEASAFSGDYGNNVTTGTGKHMVWNGGADFDNQVTSNLKITVQVANPAPAGMVHIPAGTMVGSDPDFSYNLTVDDFLMDETEVSKNLWDSHVTAGLTGSGKQGTHPVHSVSWLEAVIWCNGRSSDEGLIPAYSVGSWSIVPGASGYRLPTEEEWEYAARGGMSGFRYPWGNEIEHTNANCYLDSDFHPSYFVNPTPYTAPAESFSPNGYGLYNMSGNVWEWCTESEQSGHILRGGAWSSGSSFLRCGKSSWSSTSGNTEVGFRTIRNFSIGDELSAVISYDSRDYELTVDSEYGSPFPMVGTSALAWKTTVTCSVDAVVTEGGTNFTCVGWLGTGSVPTVGSSNEVVVLLTDLTSSISWSWADDDTDFDGMNDEWETRHFGDLAQAYSNDFDFDGQFNGDEYIAGTNPTNPFSLFALSEQVAPGTIIIEWPSATNRIYNLYWTEGLKYYDFQAIETNIAFPRNSATATPSKVRGFYRMDVRKD